MPRAACTNPHKCGNLKQPKSPPHSSGGQRPKTKMSQGCAPPSRNHPSGLHRPLVAPGVSCLWLLDSSLCLCLHMVLFPQVSLFLSSHKDMVIGFRAHPKFRETSSPDPNQLHQQRPYFQIRSHSEVLGVHEFGGGGGWEGHYSTHYRV